MLAKNPSTLDAFMLVVQKAEDFVRKRALGLIKYASAVDFFNLKVAEVNSTEAGWYEFINQVIISRIMCISMIMLLAPLTY